MSQREAPQFVWAGNGNRAVAFLLDLILLALLAGAFAPYLDSIRQLVVPLLFVICFTSMPLTPLQGTPGKWVCRIKLADRQGNRVGLRASLTRTFAQAIWFALPFVFGRVLSDMPFRGRVTETCWLLILLPWVSIGFMPRRESLFDRLAGTLVVRCRATPDDIAHAEPLVRRRVMNGVGMAFLCLVVGFILSTTIGLQRTKDLRSRVAYAIGETQSLRQTIEQFHDAENRWPDPAEMGIPEWTPFPDGGGYGVQADGSVVIRFSVLPELRGHRITFTPASTARGRIDWQCSADAGIERRYLPSDCR